MRALRILPLFAPLLLLGCEDPPAPAGTAAGSATATAAATTKKSAPPAMPPPKPLNVEGLKKALKCGGGGHGPCGVLDKFAGCIAWNPVARSGEGRWLGKGHVVKNGKFIDEFTLLRTKRVPLDEVGPGQLPAKIGITNIPDDRTTEQNHARKAIGAFSRGDVPRPNINKAITYINQRQDWPEAFSMKTEGHQVYVAVEAGAYLCELKNQQLMMVKLSGNREHKADGVYATLYAVTW
jgi:hypothetical protein